MIENNQIPSGIYNVADDEPISTNKVVSLIAESQRKKIQVWNIPKFLINNLVKFSDFLGLPINSERLNKLTETYIVSNNKIKSVINRPLPMTTQIGLLKTFESFNIE